MVKLSGFTSVNPTEKDEEGLSPTLEAEEAAVIESYEQGIQAALDGHVQEAEECFRAVLSSELVVRGATEQLQRLEVLSAKNLAITVGKQSDRIEEAIKLFREAIEKNPEDSGLIDRYGTLAARLGEWNASKDAFLTGLSLDNEHITMKMKLYEVLRHLQDYQTLYRISQFLPRGSRSSQGWRNLLGDIPQAIKYDEAMDDDKEANKCCITVSNWMELLNEVGARMSSEERPTPLINILVTNCDDIVLELDGTTDADLEENGVEVIKLDEKGMDQSGSGGVEETHQDKKLKVAQNSPRKTRRLRGNSTPERASPQLDSTPNPFSFIDGWMDKIQEPSGSPMGSCSTPALAERIKDCPVMESNPALLLHCTGCDWTLDSLCELLLLYFLQSEELNNLEDQGKDSLIDICRSMKRKVPLEYALRLTEWLIDGLAIIKASTDLGDSSMAEGKFESLQTLAENFLRTCAATMEPQLMENMSGGNDQGMWRARYLFAKAKYFEILERMETAKQYFLECLDAIGCSEEGLRLGHVTEDNIVSYSRVKFKYDTLDVHSEIHKVRDLPATRDSQTRVDSLASTILSGPEREAFMLSIDRGGWSNILRELHDAAHRVQNVRVCIKCQIRLLNANLPSATSNDMKTARERPEEYVQPLLSTSFMNVIMNSIKIENIVYHTDISSVFEDFETEIFRDVLRRLLLVMHASYQLLSAEADHVGKKKNLKVLLSHCCAFFMALLPLEWDSDQGLDVVGVLDDSFRALGQVDALLFRKSLVPYCAIPFLVRINNCQSKHDVEDHRFGLLSELLQHLLRFAFGVILPAAEKPEAIRYVTSFGSYDHRNPRCIEELIVLWPFCNEHFSSLSKQMLKKRGGEFLEKCYLVAAESLPMAMRHQMITALDKFGLLMPPKIGDSNVTADVAPRSDCTDQERMDIDLKCEIQSDALAVYSTVFHYYSRVYAPDLSALQRQEGRLLDKSDRDFESKMDACIWDLTFNRTRFENWQELAEFHQGLAEWILDECMMEGRQLTHTESLRVSRHRNIGYWCSYFAIKYSELEWNSQGMTQYRQRLMSNIFEFYGFSLLNHITDAPPEFDQCFKKPKEEDPGILNILKNALDAFIGVSRVCPNNWSSHLFIGMCLKRLGHKPYVYMPPLAHACQLANEEFGAIIDPIYEIHACRLDLLETLWDFRSNSLTAGLDDETREEILHQCALYSFREKPGISADNMQERVTELYTDAIEAMEWCLEIDSHYYKASLRLGKSKHYNPEKRFDFLNSLFSRGKSEFVFNMWHIVTKGQNVQKSKDKKKRALRREDVLVDTPYCSHHDAVTRLLNGALYADINFEGVCAKPSQRMVGIGLDEDAQFPRIFRGKLRRALLEYISIIRILGAADVLDKIIMYLGNGGQGIFNTEEFRDISAVCQGCKLVLNISKLDSMFPALELLELKNPTVFIYNREPLPMFSECNAPVEHQLSSLKSMYNVFLKYLFSEGEEWLSTVVQPVSKYLLWKIRQGDTTDEMFGKFFITKKKGTRVLGQYACLYIRRLVDLSEAETLLDVYQEFFRLQGNTSPKNPGEHLGMILCMNVWPVLRDLIQKDIQVYGTEPTTHIPAPAIDLGTSGISEMSGLTSTCDMISLYARNVMGYASQNMGDDFSKQLQEALCSTMPLVDNLIQQVVQARKRKELGDASFQINIQESKDFLGLSPQEESRGTELDTDQPVQEQDVHQEEHKEVESTEDKDQAKESSPTVPPGNTSPAGESSAEDVCQRMQSTENETAPVFGGGIAAEAIMAAMREAEDTQN